MLQIKREILIFITILNKQINQVKAFTRINVPLNYIFEFLIKIFIKRHLFCACNNCTYNT